MEQYLTLAEQIWENGTRKPNRTGIDTKSLFGLQFRHDMSDGFPLLTTKFIRFRNVVAELLWFMSGECDNVKGLNDQNVHIWDHWADEDGDLGPIYGCQWRRWSGGTKFLDPFDQLADVIQRLHRDPYDRRLVVSAWNVTDIPEMALPPCHVMFQFVFDGRLNLHMYQRSADWMIGVPYNIASYALLLKIVAHLTDIPAGVLCISYGDAHIYVNHEEGYKQQMSRSPFNLPTVRITRRLAGIDDNIRMKDIALEGYSHHPHIPFRVAV